MGLIKLAEDSKVDSLKNKEFFGINALRFFAAFWVLVFHASIHFGKLPSLLFVQPLIDQGVLAMSLFFILSGFVLSYRYRNFGNKDDWISFYSARFARLYPLYIFMGLITLWLIPQSFSDYQLPDEYGFVGQTIFSIVLIIFFLLAIQAWFPALFGVWNFGGSWSLSVEAFFYLLFPKLRNMLTNYSNKSLLYIFFGLPILMMIIFSGMIASFTEGDNLRMFYVLPILRLPEFVLGVVGYILFVERVAFRPLLNKVSALLAVLLLTAIFSKNLPGLIDYGWLASIPFLCAFILSMEISAHYIVQEFLNYLGRISYSVYLAQFFTIPVLKVYIAEFSIGFLWVIAIVSTLFVSILSHHFIENTMHRKTFSLSKSLFYKINFDKV